MSLQVYTSVRLCILQSSGSCLSPKCRTRLLLPFSLPYPTSRFRYNELLLNLLLAIIRGNGAIRPQLWVITCTSELLCDVNSRGIKMVLDTLGFLEDFSKEGLTGFSIQGLESLETDSDYSGLPGRRVSEESRQSRFVPSHVICHHATIVYLRHHAMPHASPTSPRPFTVGAGSRPARVRLECLAHNAAIPRCHMVVHSRSTRSTACL